MGRFLPIQTVGICFVYRFSIVCNHSVYENSSIAMNGKEKLSHTKSLCHPGAMIVESLWGPRMKA